MSLVRGLTITESGPAMLLFRGVAARSLLLALLAFSVWVFVCVPVAEAQGFSGETEAIRRMLDDARSLESSDPVRSSDLRRDARQRFEKLRQRVHEVDEAVGFYNETLSQSQKDAAWGAFWAGMEAGAHTARGVDKTIDLAVKLSGADRNPQVKALMEAKGWAHTTISVTQKLNDGETYDAAVEVVSKVDNPKVQMAAGMVETGRALDRGDYDAARSSAVDVLEATAKELEMTPEARALDAWNTAMDVEVEARAATESLDAASDFLDQRDRYSKQEGRSARLDEDNARRHSELAAIASEYDSLYDDRSATPADQDVQRVLALLQQQGAAASALDAVVSTDNALGQQQTATIEEVEQLARNIGDRIDRLNEDAYYEHLDFAQRDSEIRRQQDLLAQLNQLRDQMLAGGHGDHDSRDHDPGDEDDEEEDDAVDHCLGGAFQCPNGLPWPQCGHAEKYDCPPAEYAAEADQHKSSNDGPP